MELEKIIAKSIKDDEFAKDSLSSEDSEGLHLYWNKKNPALRNITRLQLCFVLGNMY